MTGKFKHWKTTASRLQKIQVVFTIVGRRLSLLAAESSETTEESEEQDAVALLLVDRLVDARATLEIRNSKKSSSQSCSVSENHATDASSMQTSWLMSRILNPKTYFDFGTEGVKSSSLSIGTAGLLGRDFDVDCCNLIWGEKIASLSLLKVNAKHKQH